MWIAVMGLMMLTGAVVREQGKGFDDFGWRRGQGGMEQAAANESSSGGAAVTVIAGPPMGTVSMSGGDEADASASTQSQLEGAWDLACESKRGNHMVFDRDSIREIGNDNAVPVGSRRRRSRIGGRGLHRGRRLSRQEHRSALAGQAHGDARGNVRAASWSTPSAPRARTRALGKTDDGHRGRPPEPALRAAGAA